MSQLNHFDYFTDIERAFVKRRGQHMMISPLDWALIESWEKRGIPLRIVLASVDEVFDSIRNKAGDPTSIRSLKYCEEAVERRFKTWRDASIGKSENAKADTDAAEKDLVSNHIARLIVALRKIETGNEPLRETIKSTSDALESMSNSSETDDSFDMAEFDRLDELIDAAILRNREDLLTEKLESVVDAVLSDFEETARNEAYGKVVCKTVRKEYGIPQMSIYEL